MKKLNQIVFVALAAAVALTLAACQTGSSSDPEPEPTPVVVTYTVTFDANGGAAVASITADENTTVNLPATTRAGYTFAGWDTNGDNTADASSFTITANVTAKALWTANQYKVTFTNEFEYGFLEMTDLNSKDYGSTVTISAPVDDPDTYSNGVFDYWEDVDTGTHYVAGDTLTIPVRNVTLKCHAHAPAI